MVGYAANNLIPVRIGELMRAYYLTLREGVGTMSTFGTVVLERASDVIALLLLVGVAALFGSLGLGSTFSTLADDVPGGAPVLATVALLPFVAVFGMVAYVVVATPDGVRSLMTSVMRWVPEGLRAKIVDTAMNLIAGLTAVRTWRGLVKVIALSLPVWLSELAMYYVIALGFDIRVEFDGQLAFIAAIVAFGAAANLAGVLPSSAGSWGPFDFFGAAALTALGVEAEIAAAYALTVHVVLWGPVTIAGAILLLLDKTSMANLARGARAARESDEPVPQVDRDAESRAVEAQP